jgi:hypothetical protein
VRGRALESPSLTSRIASRSVGLRDAVGSSAAIRSRIRYLVRVNGNPYAWSPYKFAVYLISMRETAERLDVAPDLLELALFNA